MATQSRPFGLTPHQSRTYLITGLKYLFLIVLCFVVMAPVITTVLGSVRTTGEFLTAPFALPLNGIQWGNYIDILIKPDYWNLMKNSLVITVTVTALNVVLASMLAFVFTRIEFRGRSLLFNILSLGLLFPIVIAILPIFLQIRQLHLIDSL